MRVVKLGGSLFDSDHLRQWLSALTRNGPLVVVPGGGPFADQVRRAQARWGFDDRSAHLMALLAMEQYGRMLCGMAGGLSPAADLAQIDQALARGETPVWLPLAMVEGEAAMEQSWELTSDSLAAWLCGRLGADSLLLVKRTSPDGSQIPAQRLVELEIVDPLFDSYLRGAGVAAWILAETDHERFSQVLQGEMGAFCRITLSADR